MPSWITVFSRFALAFGALWLATNPALAANGAMPPAPVSNVASVPAASAPASADSSKPGFFKSLFTPKPPPPVTGDAITPAQCEANPYKRKLLVTPFWVRQPSQSQDLRQLQSGLQDMLGRKFTGAGGWLTSASKQEVPFDLQPRFDAPIFLPDHIRILGRQFGAQLIVGGIVQDLSTEGTSYNVTYGDDSRVGEKQLVMDGPLSFFDISLKSAPSRRNADIEIFVFDSVSGALVAQRRMQTVITGDVLARASQPVGSEGFMNTGLGKGLDRLLNQLVAGAQADVACVPFSARVVKVENGLAYLDAGAMSGLSKGDHLQFFREKYGMQPIETPGSKPGMGLGLPEERTGTATVVQVQTQFAAVTVDKGPPEPGDFVRAMPRRERKQTAQQPEPVQVPEAAPQADSGATVSKLTP